MRIEASAQGSVVVTPSDTVDIPVPAGVGYTKGLYVGVSGDIKMTMGNGTVVTRKAVAAGMTHPWNVSRVWATGTTATDMLGDY